MIRISPSILNSWDELRKVDDESPPWVTPENFKESVMGVFKPSMKAGAGNACSRYLFEDVNDHEEAGLLTEAGTQSWKYRVGEGLLKMREWFQYGAGVAEVPVIMKLEDTFDGEEVSISMRADYLCPSEIVELKSSSRTFSAKGKTRSYLESMQSFAYTMRWKKPIKFLFAFIEIEECENGIFKIEPKHLSKAVAHPSKESEARLIDCVASIVPYLKADPEMYERVTSRTPVSEF